jgi:hypothetical protein
LSSMGDFHLYSRSCLFGRASEKAIDGISMKLKRMIKVAADTKRDILKL